MKGHGSRPRRRRRPEEDEYTPGERLEDAWTAAELQAALLSLTPSTGLRVDVDAEEGVVFLRGEVASEAQKAEAEQIVRGMRLRGVKEIRNELVVNPLAPHLPRP